MNKHVCDRCGAEIVTLYSFTHLFQTKVHYASLQLWKRKDETRTLNVDLCPKCYDELDDWLEGRGRDEARS